MLRQLSCLRPLPNVLEVAACVLGVEIDECFWRCWIPPYLPEHADVDCAHELLPENVEAVGLRG